MRNKLGDLNNHLFEQLERLNDEDLKGDKLNSEIKRARAISSVATKIIENGNLIIKGQKFIQEYFQSPGEIFDDKIMIDTSK